MIDALRFWLLAEVVGLLALPVAGALFARLPGSGLTLARPLGLLLATYPVWLLASLHVLPYGLVSAWLGLLVLAVLALGVTIYEGMGGRTAWYRRWDRLERRLWLTGEALYLVAFAGWTVLRSYAPDVWGTEKPMDMAFINAINRSGTMPPHDPWLSGVTINYYYYGHFIIAWLIRLTGVQPWVGFNLGVALMYALTAGAVFGVAATLFAAIRRSTEAAVSPILPGLAAAALAMLAGNLDGALELLQKPGPLLQFDWWSPSRVIADTITEFPFFSFLLADLHAHMMATPFGLTALAFALQLALAGPRLPHRRAGDKVAGSARIACAGEVLLAGLVAGSLYALNGWDYPTELGIGFLCLLLWASRRQAGVPAGPLAIWAGAWLLVSFLLFLPFYVHFKAPQGGLGIVRQHASLVQYLHDYLLIYGVAVWVLGAAFYHRWRTFNIAGRHAVWAGIVALAVLVLLAPAHLDGPALLLAACVFALLAATDDRLAQPARLWWLIVGVAIGLASVGEVVYLRDAFAGSPNYRMNTIFKFGYQAWFLFAIAAGCGAFWRKRWRRPAPRFLWGGSLVVLVACAGVYTIAGTDAREGGFRSVPTLDGLQWLQKQAPGDAAAILWLNGHVQGAPTVLEAVGSDYDPAGHARISTFTGLPTVLGWPGHEAQWAHDQGTRQQDVATLYSTTDLPQSRVLLARYAVRYVIVGTLEHADFPPTGLAKFAQLGTAVYSNGGTVIYMIGR